MRNRRRFPLPPFPPFPLPLLPSSSFFSPKIKSSLTSFSTLLPLAFPFLPPLLELLPSLKTISFSPSLFTLLPLVFPFFPPLLELLLSPITMSFSLSLFTLLSPIFPRLPPLPELLSLLSFSLIMIFSSTSLFTLPVVIFPIILPIPLEPTSFTFGSSTELSPSEGDSFPPIPLELPCSTDGVSSLSLLPSDDPGDPIPLELCSVLSGSGSLFPIPLLTSSIESPLVIVTLTHFSFTKRESSGSARDRRLRFIKRRRLPFGTLPMISLAFSKVVSLMSV